MQLAYAAVMARLLEPQAFGLIAGAMLAIKFVTYPAKFGVSAALIQRPHLDDRDLRVAFSISLAAGAAGTLLVLVISTPLSHILGQPGVASVSRWLGVTLVLGAFATVPEALLRKRMQFRSLTIINIGVYFCSNILIAIPLAMANIGAMSLVVAVIANVALSAVFLSLISSFKPRLAFDVIRAKKFAGFGGLVAITSLLDVISSSADTAVVGRMGASQLGQYSRSTFLVSLPVEQVSSAANRVIAPGLSQLQSDSARFGSALTVSLGLTACLVAVPIAVAAAVASELVPLALGPGWGLAAKVLPFVSASSGMGLITQVITSASDARGAVRQRFCVQLMSVVVIVAAVATAAAVFGTPLAVAIAWMCGEVFRLAAHSLLAVKWLSVPLNDLVSRFFNAAILGVFAGTPGFLIIHQLGWNGIGALAAALAGAALLLAALWLLWPSAPYRLDIKRLNLKQTRLTLKREHTNDN